jgi:hypothetical protein
LHRTTLKEPEKPGLAFMVLGSLMTPSLLLGTFFAAIGIASQLVEPFMMKELLKVVLEKGKYEIYKQINK